MVVLSSDASQQLVGASPVSTIIYTKSQHTTSPASFQQNRSYWMRNPSTSQSLPPLKTNWNLLSIYVLIASFSGQISPPVIGEFHCLPICMNIYQLSLLSSGFLTCHSSAVLKLGFRLELLGELKYLLLGFTSKDFCVIGGKGSLGIIIFKSSAGDFDRQSRLKVT